jgi:hypothetical protein
MVFQAFFNEQTILCIPARLTSGNMSVTFNLQMRYILCTFIKVALNFICLSAIPCTFVMQFQILRQIKYLISCSVGWPMYICQKKKFKLQVKTPSHFFPLANSIVQKKFCPKIPIRRRCSTPLLFHNYGSM